MSIYHPQRSSPWTYAEFQREIDEIDAEIKRRRSQNRDWSLLLSMREEIIRAWQEKPES
jgi:hypothetical protein